MTKPIKEERKMKNQEVKEVLICVTLSLLLLAIFCAISSIIWERQEKSLDNYIAELNAMNQDRDGFNYEKNKEDRIDVIPTQAQLKAKAPIKTDIEVATLAVEVDEEPPIVTWDPNSLELENVTGATREHLELLLDRIMEYQYREPDRDGVLYRNIDTYMYVEEEYGISAISLMVIMSIESGMCNPSPKRWSLDFRYASNCTGIKKSGGPRWFDSVEECLKYTGELIRDSYIDENGFETLQDMANKYCDKSWGVLATELNETYNQFYLEIINSTDVE